MDLDLSGILSKLELVLPYLSYGIALMHKVLDMLSSYMGFDIGQNGESESASEEASSVENA